MESEISPIKEYPLYLKFFFENSPKIRKSENEQGSDHDQVETYFNEFLISKKNPSTVTGLRRGSLPLVIDKTRGNGTNTAPGSIHINDEHFSELENLINGSDVTTELC